MQRDYERSQATYYLSQVDECVVRRSPAEGKAMIFATAQSPEEKAALQPLMPALSECTPAGSKLAYNRLALRGALAINYYRLAKASLNVAAVAGRALGPIPREWATL